MSATAQAFENTETLDLAALRQMTYGTRSALSHGAAASDHFCSRRTRAWRNAGMAIPAQRPLAWFLCTFGASSSFPWEGKSFEREKEHGRGINRVNFFFGKRKWFPFKTRFATSFLDGKPTFLLDYSGPANPLFIRSIVDEIREVAPGLYLGPAALLVKGKPKPILFFAVSLQ